ncbi:hypothetical protein ACF082_18945 [Streptomyces lydicus]|uniref:hypothetical protein n=1 Tax=Streptomyces lydicus TaxID=47763 RepID=UPI0036F9B8EC
MIRIVTCARLAAMQHDADGARERAREIQGAADRAYAGHLRTVYDLTADTEAAERAAEADQADAEIVREILERTEAQLADARATVAEQTARIDELSAPSSADASMALLLYYGKPHSIHPDRSAAYAYAATLGAPSSGWAPVGERPAAELQWVCVPFIYDSACDHFRSVTAPAVEPLGGAA